jgi:endonuclease YncB( thermonuclease family)
MSIRIITGVAPAAVCLCVSLSSVFVVALPTVADTVQPSFERCGSGIRFNCIVDGDTLWNSGVKIRVADIDTPEISQPRCAAEKALGERATTRLMELVNAGSFQMQAWLGRDEDRYGRKLRVLVRDGRSLGGILVSEGLARTWAGKREPWC